MEIWQGLVGLGLGLLGSVITWFFTSVNKDKEKGVRLAFDSEKTAESLKKVEAQIKKLESTNDLHSKTLNTMEENSALAEQREQNMLQTLSRIEQSLNDNSKEHLKVYSDLMNMKIKGDKENAQHYHSAISLLASALKEHPKQK